MHFSTTALGVLFATSATVAAREVPANVRSFYNKVKAQDRCPNELQGGFHSKDNDNKGMVAKPSTRRIYTSNLLIHLHDKRSGTVKIRRPASSTCMATENSSSTWTSIATANRVALVKTGDVAAVVILNLRQASKTPSSAIRLASPT